MVSASVAVEPVSGLAASHGSTPVAAQLRTPSPVLRITNVCVTSTSPNSSARVDSERTGTGGTRRVTATDCAGPALGVTQTVPAWLPVARWYRFTRTVTVSVSEVHWPSNGCFVIHSS